MMPIRTFEEKKAFAAKIRARNYAASLRLEGINGASVSSSTTKDDIIEKYRQTKRLE